MNGKLVHDKRYDGRVHMVNLMLVRTSQWEMIWWINSWAYFQKITRTNEIVKSVIPWNCQISWAGLAKNVLGETIVKSMH